MKRKSLDTVFEYRCPKCNKLIIYKQQYSYIKALLINKLCRDCNQIQDDLVRKCPKCGCDITYKRRSDYLYGLNHNTCCKRCSNNAGKFSKGIRNFENYNNKSTIPHYNLNNLLNHNLQSYYWIGVIIADGNFYNNRFEISFKESDLQYLQQFALYIGFDISKIKYRKSTNSYRIAFSNRYSIPNIMHYFNILYNKTYNPCKFNDFAHLSYEQLLSIFIGLIDGDGYISKDGSNISITAYKTWIKFYSEFIKYINLPFYIHNYRDVITIRSGKKSTGLYLYNFIKEHNLFVLNRKWNRIKI